MSWCDRLSTGDVAHEQKLREEIQKANRELKKIKKASKISGWSAVLSLPVDVALLLSGIPVPTSPVGFGIHAYEKIKARKYDWVMFGR